VDEAVPADAPAPVAGPPLRVLAWDAPNIDVALGTLLGGRKPAPGERPRWDALARWLVGRTGADEDVEAAVFLNVGAVTPQLRDWVQVLRNLGFAVFGKPRTTGSDIDRDLLDYVWGRLGEREVAEVLIASGDQFREFDDNIGRLAAHTRVTVLGFAESNPAAYALDSAVEFVDLESIPGLFEVALPRDTLAILPPEGRWLRPLRSLREAVGQARPTPSSDAPPAAAPAVPSEGDGDGDGNAPAPVTAPGPEPGSPEVATALLRRARAELLPTAPSPDPATARAKTRELVDFLARHDDGLSGVGLPLAHTGYVVAALVPGFAPRDNGFEGLADLLRHVAAGTPLAIFRGAKSSDVWLGLRAHPPAGAISQDPDPDAEAETGNPTAGSGEDVG